MANLSFVNLQKIYPNNVQAVFNFSLDIKDKEFIVFVGPSGCGKSTTLRMVAGLEDISGGELYIDNKLVNFVDPKDRDIAMVFQSYALYPHMTVFDNMSFGLKIRKNDLPVYEENDEINNIYKEIAQLRKQLKVIGKAIKKDPNDKKLKSSQNKIKDEIIDNYQKIEKLKIPKTGICVYLVNKNLKKSALLKKENIKLERSIRKLSAKDSEKYSLIIENYKKQIEYNFSEIKKAESDAQKYQNNETVILKNRKLNKNEIYYEVLKVAIALDLFVYLDRKPAQLSGGQRQRVALGRAIVRKPKVFLMDEPLSNLDAKLRTQTRSEIAKIHRDVGATTIYVTHDQVEAMTLADRIVIMKDGYIQQIATPKEAYEKPVNMFVAGFIGSPAMSFINGTFDGKKFICEKCDNEFELPLDSTICKELSAYKNKEIVLGIRPEDLHVASSSLKYNKSDEYEFYFYDRELLGNELLCYIRFGNNKVLSKVTNAIDDTKFGKEKFCFNLDKLHFFDPETTNRII